MVGRAAGSVLAWEADAELSADLVEDAHDPDCLVQRQQVGLGFPSGQEPRKLCGLVGQSVFPARWLVPVDLSVEGIEQTHSVRLVEPTVDLDARCSARDRRR